MVRLRHHVDLALVLGAWLIITGVAVAYVAIMRAQRDRPELWFIAALALSVALGIGGFASGGSRRRTLLIVCAIVLVVLGALSVLSVGAPLLLAGALTLAAALHRQTSLDRP
jgi:uncharacterized membrane protein HdeD (DUF308 family)